MTIRIVAFDPLLEPENFRDAQSVAEKLFDFPPAEAWIPIGIEEDRFGGEQLASAVDFDGSALQDHPSLKPSLAQ